MAKLYELANNYRVLEDMIAADPENMEVIKDTLEAIEGSMEEKAENIIRMMKNIKADQEAYKGEADRLAGKAKTAENQFNYWKKYLEDMMILAGLEKLKAGIHTLRIQDNPPSLELLVPESRVPDEFRKPQPDKIDRAGMLKVLKEDPANKVLEGIAKTTKGKSIRIG